ncbi:MAG: hypothetical protein LBH86_00460 [Oscillospiraceae bacterium]|nr:hypothetical protein [Oscillospiraceae bacterium]
MGGGKFLRITGILMIIGGALSILLGVIALFGSLIIVTGAAQVLAASILALVGGAAELVAGIFGVIYADRPDKAHICIVMGIIVAVLSVASNLLSFNASTLLAGLLLPVLYLVGAFKNKPTA